MRSVEQAAVDSTSMQWKFGLWLSQQSSRSARRQAKFDKAVRHAPTLQALNRDTNGLLAKKLGEVQRSSSALYFWCASSLIAVLVCHFVFPFTGAPFNLSQGVLQLSLVLYYSVVVLLAARALKRSELLIRSLFYFIRDLERCSDSWLDRKTRRRLVSRLGKLATAMEQFPYSVIYRNDKSLFAEMQTLARGKAASLRELRIWIIRPREDTYIYLVETLVARLRLLIEGRWFELPEADAGPSRPHRLKSVVLGAVCLALLGGLIALTVYSSRFGATATVTASVLGIILVGLLTQYGIAVSSIAGAADAVSKFTRVDKS